MTKATGIGALKSFRYLALLFVILIGLATIVATGGGNGGEDSSLSTGTLSMSIADAKPLLPAETENVWITFEELLVHKSGGGWISLPLAQTPYTIDLYQFYCGKSTHLVPPVSLDTGKYTQIRIVISEAEIKIDDKIFPVKIPSENLKTDKNFDFTVIGGGAVDVTIDFDLSKSIVVTGLPGEPSYKLKPVLHIVKTSEAATIIGSIGESTFLNSSEATVAVFWDNDGSCDYSPDDEAYTEVTVLKGAPATFSIFWLVPDQGYTVKIYLDGVLDPVFEEFVEAIDLGPGSTFALNAGNSI
jgi:hypothetical protein